MNKLAYIVCILIAATGWQASVSAATYSLAYKKRSGESFHYVLSQRTSSGEAGPDEVRMSVRMRMSELVKSVNPLDLSTTETIIPTQMISGMWNGQPISREHLDGFAPNSQKIVVDRCGRVLSCVTVPGRNNEAELSNPNIDGPIAVLPDRPVRIGESWTSKIPVKGLHVTFVLTSTLLSISLVGASAVAHIQCGYKSIPGPFKSVQNSQNGVYQVNSTCTEDFDIGKGLVTKVSGNILTYESDTKPVVPSGMVVMPEKPFRSTTVFDVTLSKN